MLCVLWRRLTFEKTTFMPSSMPITLNACVHETLWFLACEVETSLMSLRANYGSHAVRVTSSRESLTTHIVMAVCSDVQSFPGRK